MLAIAKDRIVPVGKPIVAEGQLGEFVPGAVTRLGAITQIRSDLIPIRVWTGYFFATVLVRVDWLGGTLTLAQHCFYQTGHGPAEEGCEGPVQDVERRPASQDFTFVRLFPESRDPSGPPVHVVIKPDSHVEILGAKVNVVTWEDLPDAIQPRRER